MTKITKTKSVVKAGEINFAALDIKTPPEFIKKRPGAGGKQFSYVEIGYVIRKLNEAFSPLNWDFKITDKIEKPKEIIVQGELTVKDHKGNSVVKTQFGQGDFKSNVSFGDVYKAATSDALKKCASLLGVALDVYAPQLENWDRDNIPVVESDPPGTQYSENSEAQKLSEPQRKKLFVQIKLLGKDKDWFEGFAGPIEEVTKAAASAYIEEFEKKINEK